MLSFWVYPGEVIGQDAFERGGIAGRDRLGPLALALDDVILDLLLRLKSRALAKRETEKSQARTKQKGKGRSITKYA